jgi:hypothetical protein
MNKFSLVIRTSEFWVALVAAVVSVLVNANVLTKEAADFVNMAFVYVIGRLVSKTVKNVIPEGGIK